MKELHDRINRVINTPAFEAALEKSGVFLFEFQSEWKTLSNGDFEKLPESFKSAILAGEAELKGSGELVID